MKIRKLSLWLAGATAAVLLASGAGTASAATLSASSQPSVSSQATTQSTPAVVTPDVFETVGPVRGFALYSQCVAAISEFPEGEYYEGGTIVAGYCEWDGHHYQLYIVIDVEASSCPGPEIVARDNVVAGTVPARAVC